MTNGRPVACASLLPLAVLLVGACASTAANSSTTPGAAGTGTPTEGGNAPSSPDAGVAPPDAGAPEVGAPPPDASPSPDASDAGDLVTRLLALTANCKPGQPNTVPTPTPYHSEGATPVDVSICKLQGALFWNSGMNIDCDGRTTPHCPGTGADKDCCYQNDTSFHANDGQPLAAEYTPYVVIPNNFSYPGLDTKNGGNVLAVIHAHQIQYAVFGDTGPNDIIGEASWATANGLGINPSPASGGVDHGVTYVVFIGAGTRPSDITSPSEAAQLGATLAQQLVTNN